MQARVGSTRLPAKVLKEILGKTVLEHDLERCLRIRKVDGIIIATTNEPEADKIIQICALFPADKVKFYRGSIEDVLSRYYESALMVQAQTIIRLTSDCPLLDPLLVDDMIETFMEKRRQSPPLDYLCNTNPRTFPQGLDTEIFTFSTLERAFLQAKDPYEREHVTPYIRRHPEIFTFENFSQSVDQSSYRWTLDYPEDFEFIKLVYESLYPQNPAFDRHDIVTLLKEHPEIQSINANRRQR